MTILLATLVVCGLLFAALFALYRWGRPKPSAPDPREPARDAEKRADDAIDRKAAADVAEVEKRRDEQAARDPVDLANDVIRRGAFVLLLVLAIPARAEEPPCVRVNGRVECTAAGFATLIKAGVDAGAARDTCRVQLGAEQQKRAEAEKRIAALEAMPAAEEPARWPWFVAGVGTGAVLTAAGVVAVVLLVR